MFQILKTNSKKKPCDWKPIELTHNTIYVWRGNALCVLMCLKDLGLKAIQVQVTY